MRCTATLGLLAAVVLFAGLGCSGSSDGSGGGDVGVRADGGEMLDCPEGETTCGGECVDTATSDDHCGECGRACRTDSSSGQCRAGSCTAWSCNAGYIDTDADPSNGCERQCAGQSIASDGVLDGDLDVVDVQGTLTRVGTLPDTYSRWSGALVFRQRSTGETYQVAFDRSADQTTAPYRIRLYSGVYDVEFRPATGCSESDDSDDSDQTDEADDSETPPHCQTQLLREQLQLTSDGTLDLEGRIAPPAPETGPDSFEVAGTVTKNGAAIEADRDRVGRVEFVADSGVTQTAPIASDGTYEVSLVAGTYEVRVDNEEACGDTPVLPCHARTLREGLAIQDGGALDLDVPVVEVSGTVRVDGEPLREGDDGSNRGAVTFADPDDDSTSETLGADGAASYEVLLYPETSYRITLSRSDCADIDDPVLPCMSHRVAERQFNSSGVYDIDVAPVTVAGAVTVAGQNPRESITGNSRGVVTFQGAEDARSLPLGTDGPADFEVLLYPGDYDVTLTNDADCPDDASQAFPCQSKLLRDGIDLTGSGTLDLDVEPITVSGAVTVDGQTASDSATGNSRGTVTFGGPGGAPSDQLGTEGAAEFDAKLYPGSYDVTLANGSDCPDDASQAFPCQSTMLRDGIELIASGTLDLDVQPARVTGEVTVNETSLEEDTGPRGSLLFATADDRDQTVSTELARDGAATFETLVYPDDYDIEYTNSACESDRFPCQRVVLQEGLSVTTDGSLTYDLTVIEVRGEVSVDGETMAEAKANRRGDVRFVQVGDAAPPDGAERTVPVDESGPAAYELRIVPGTYVAEFDGRDCPAEADRAGVVPCGPDVMIGCGER
jgi:hypothetical protein